VPNEDNVVDTVEVTSTIKAIYINDRDIDCLEVHDFEIIEGVLSEDTLDWYAKDIYGNVWYCREDTKAYL